MMPRINAILLVGAAGVLLSACASGSIANRKRPDEFAVSKQAPLIIPPDFTLSPPKPGAPRPLAADTQQQALEALLGPNAKLQPRSQIENQLLDAANASNIDPSIRNTAGDRPGTPAVTTVDKGAFVRELLDAPASTRNPDVAKVTVGG